MKVTRKKRGVQVSFEPIEALSLRQLPMRLLAYLDDFDFTNPVTQRLFPPASDDDEVNREFTILAGQEVRRRKRENVEAFVQTLEAAEVNKGACSVLLDPEMYEHWLGFINDMRLLLATELDIQENGWLDAFTEKDLEDETKYLYYYLTWLQEALLSAG